MFPLKINIPVYWFLFIYSPVNTSQHESTTKAAFWKDNLTKIRGSSDSYQNVAQE